MLTRLVVLGLLLRRAMSGYEIQRYLQLNPTEQWAGILPGSIYHALKKLEQEGLVALRATEQTGNRARAIYAVTEAGQEEFRRLLRETWWLPAPHFPSALYAALGFLDDLPREEVVAALEEQIAALEARLAVWNAGESAKSSAIPEPLPEYMGAIFENGRQHLELDLRFLRYLREAVPSFPRFAPPLPDVLREEESE